MQDTNSFHVDEYLEAHFSYSLGDITKLDWFAVYPPTGVWICQFPVLFFFFQKIFFNIFGVSTLVMRWSVVPYIVIIFTFLFLTAKKLFGGKTAILAVSILALFSPDLYLSKWALHFISSTAIFMTAAYFFIMSIKDNKKIYYGLAGFFIGLCYSTYYSSYVAIPLFIVYIIALIIQRSTDKKVFRNLILTLFTCLYTLSPLLVYAAKVDNFFSQRTEQVKLINGTWSPYKNIVATPSSVFGIIAEQTSLSVQSLYKDGIGGIGGYWFGHYALFDFTTFIFIIISFLYFVFRIVTKKSADKTFILSIIMASFVGGMILSMPPPAFHRFSLAFPFLAVIISVTIIDFYELIKGKYKIFAFPILSICLFLILLGNATHFKKILLVDGPDDPDFAQIELSLKKEGVNFVYISAFDSYGLNKFLFIRSGKATQSITHPMGQILPVIPKKTTSYLIILYPNIDLIAEVRNEFPNSKIIGQYERHLLMKIN